jgi:hypothetical protein
VHRAPGIPHALFGAEDKSNASGASRREDEVVSGTYQRHCERSEAIHRAAKRKMDCFVAEFIIGPAEGRTRWPLAMTVRAV